MASRPRAFSKVFLPVLPSPPLPPLLLLPRRRGAAAQGAGGVAGAAVMAAAPAPRKWEGVVDEALEREVLGACLDQAPERRRVREAFKDVQLSIDHCLFKKGQYSGVGTKESYERNSRGVEIFSKCWFPENHSMKAIVCFCHGYGDTCTFFLDGVARKIASAGYGVFALDYPGFGLSEGLHGYIPSFDTLVDDVAEHFAKIKGNPEHRGLPSFLFGQSMGGAVALKVHFKQPNEWNSAILVAPMCKIADDVVPPWPVQQVLIFLARLLPREKLVPQKDLAELAFKEKKKREQTSYNVIAYKDKPRLRTALEMLKTTQEIERHLEEVSLPMIILHGEADLVTDPAVSKALYEKAKSSDKKLCLYKDAYHAILEGEPDETIFQVLDDIISWLDQHSTKEVPLS
ncbi:caffeoylshikimate esterase isoform X2 [Phragmites australis]|uniref:caffeoylshikimate esterase isoform X2 n=1 Tax=Phragmites australis TaxID=29695 RepID=UPI002D77487F|nr:caffeoylshikimate esterase isoform X2 [Phragmites australis]